MNQIPATLATLALTLVASGCIRPEAPNAEADILTAQIEGIELIRPSAVTNDKVTFYANPWEDLTALAPVFTLTPGAKIEPASGSKQDFTRPVTYTVTSEDGKWTKDYTVTVSVPENMKKTVYSFEDTKLQDKKFHIFLIKNASGDVTGEWVSSNLGYAIGAEVGILPGKPDDYPATQVEDGYKGKALQLATRSIKPLADAFGSFMKVPLLAAGSLYLGKLNTGLLMKDALKATEFGIPVFQKPLMMTGYYKYTPGDQMIDEKGNNQGGQDLFDIYAIVYEVTPDVPFLDGTNNLTSDNLVMIARIADPDRKPATEWTRFEIPFKTLEGKTLDPVKLAKGQYNYSVVFSSSKDGARFIGAPGSTLTVDEVEVYFE